MILYSNKNKKLHLTESQISRLLENYEDEAFKRTEPVYYSADDKISLVKDPYDSLDKSQQHGNMRNFAIRRNGKVDIGIHCKCNRACNSWNAQIGTAGRNINPRYEVSLLNHCIGFDALFVIKESNITTSGRTTYIRTYLE